MSLATQRRGPGNERGYALITILFFLGVVAIMLARSLPRDAMRAQRTREETLIYRGEQYARAVELYFREHQRYPESLRDLEETDGVRFLRRRYRDPITGEDEWRLIKMGTDGRFEDSLVYDTERDDPTGRKPTPAAQAFATAQAAIANPQQQAAPQRQSAAPDNPFATGNQPYGGAFPGQLAGGANPAQPQFGPDGQPIPGGTEDYSQVRPDQVPLNAGQVGRNTPGIDPRTNRPEQAQPSGFQPPAGFGPQSLSPQAGELLSNLLTRPRPGGLAGLQGQTAPQQAGGGPQASFQEGIAGVASTSERSGVKVYKDRELYKEWEFVYDYRQDAQTAAAGIPGTVQPGGNLQQGQPGITPSGVLGGNPGARQQDPRLSPSGVQPGGQPAFPFGIGGTTPPVGAPLTQPTETPGTRRRTRPRSPAEFRPATPVAPQPENESVPDQNQ
jgi:type II secretory pathway pseudopilin PulG